MKSKDVLLSCESRSRKRTPELKANPGVKRLEAFVIGLVDCNNFYVSCERVFAPGLCDRPVVVLSNNDGCVVSRSNEAKDIGVGMGAPLFEVRDLLRKHDGVIRSSNYTLYGDMSRRVMETLGRFTGALDIYSIDEAFMRLPTSVTRADLEEIRRVVYQWTGIPVSIGVGATKTLAKLANRAAKKDAGSGGVCQLTDGDAIERLLGQTPVGAIWGVGPRYAKKLGGYGIRTAADLCKADREWVRQQMSVVGLRTVMELCGESCIGWEEEPAPAKGICRSRSFGKPVSSLEQMSEAVALYASRAAEKLRSANRVAGSVSVYVTTNSFRAEDRQYANKAVLRLRPASDDTMRIVGEALRGLRAVYRPGYRYKKAGVFLDDLAPRGQAQGELFEEVAPEGRAALLRTVDGINATMGADRVRLGALGFKPTWQMRREYGSPRYTTRWDELARVG